MWCSYNGEFCITIEKVNIKVACAMLLSIFLRFLSNNSSKIVAIYRDFISVEVFCLDSNLQQLLTCCLHCIRCFFGVPVQDLKFRLHIQTKVHRSIVEYWFFLFETLVPNWPSSALTTSKRAGWNILLCFFSWLRKCGKTSFLKLNSGSGLLLPV